MKEPKNNGPTREELNQFIEDIAVNKAMSLSGDIPEIEAPRSVVEYYNRKNLEGFDSVGYFIYEGVKVYEAGKMQDAKKKDAVTVEERNFGGK